ncbi:MAG: carboxymuconolactone decarboxylase family protein [Puia sp.]
METKTIGDAPQHTVDVTGLDLNTNESGFDRNPENYRKGYLLIASCTTLGHAQPQLRAHIEAAIRLGGSKDTIVEVILQMIFYAGGANVSNALTTVKQVFQENDLSRNIN